MNRVSFVPTAAAYSFNQLAIKPAAIVAPTVPAFTTKRTGRDRVSAPVVMEAMVYDEKTKSIKVFCSDGNLRECRTERLPSKEVARQLWKRLQEAGVAKSEVKFVAAGGFSPDKWFYDFA